MCSLVMILNVPVAEKQNEGNRAEITQNSAMTTR